MVLQSASHNEMLRRQWAACNPSGCAQHGLWYARARHPIHPELHAAGASPLPPCCECSVSDRKGYSALIKKYLPCLERDAKCQGS